MSNISLLPSMVTRFMLKRECWIKGSQAPNLIEVSSPLRRLLTTSGVKGFSRLDGAYWYLQRSSMRLDSRYGMRTWRDCGTFMKEAPSCDEWQYHTTKSADGDGTRLRSSSI